MALQTPCTGKEIIDEINNVSDEIDYSREHINTQIQTTMDDSFHIGDLIDTSRTDMGDKYLLCNGENIYTEDGYQQLIDFIGDSTKKYVTKTLTNQLCYAVGTTIYTFFVVNNNVYATKYASLKNFENSIFEKQSIIFTYDATSITLKGIVSFKNNVYISLVINDETSALITSSENAIDVEWEMLVDTMAYTGGEGYSLAANDDSLWLAYTYFAQTGSIANPDYSLCIKYQATTNGQDFTTPKAIVVTTVGYSLGTAKQLSVQILNNNVVMHTGYKVDSSNPSFIIWGNIDFSQSSCVSQWNYNKDVYGNHVVGGNSIYNIVYHSDGYYYMGVRYHYNGTSLVFRGKTPNCETRYLYKLPTSELCLTSRGDNLVMGSNYRIYTSGESGNYTQINSQYLTALNLPSWGATTKFFENDELYIYGTSTVQVVPKNNLVAALPTVGSNVGYTYIKAKE